MAYQMDASSDILNILSSQGTAAYKIVYCLCLFIVCLLGSTAAMVTSYIFPVCALVTSIPVFTIVIRSNLSRGQICSEPWAIFWSNFLPWLICM